jgi:hypothetical protein
MNLLFIAGGEFMKRLLALGVLVLVALSACAAPATTQQAVDTTKQAEIIVFKPSN